MPNFIMGVLERDTTSSAKSKMPAYYESIFIKKLVFQKH